MKCPARAAPFFPFQGNIVPVPAAEPSAQRGRPHQLPPVPGRFFPYRPFIKSIGPSFFLQTKKHEGLETNSHGCIVTNGEDGLTSRTGVYAGGDAVTGAATVILAMGAGKSAAAAIDKYIKEGK